MKSTLVVLFLVFFCPAQAQDTAHDQDTWKPKWLYVSGENLFPAKPFSGIGKLFSTYMHPGFNVGADVIRWNGKGANFEQQTHQLVQSINLGYFYHAQVQHAIHLNTFLNYRYGIHLSKKNKSKTLGLQARLGTGYFHSIPLVQRFRLNNDGEYERIRGIGRPQLDIVIGAGLDYTNIESDDRVFLRYNSRLQMPFVKSYVPLFPYGVLEAGYAIYLFAKRDQR